MRNYIFIAALLISFTSFAQGNKAVVNKVGGKDVYVMAVPTVATEFISKVTLTDQEVAASSSLKDRIELFQSKVKKNSYDLIFTRDGKTAQFKKYKNESNNYSTVTNENGKDVFFMSLPSQEYGVVKESPLTEKEVDFNYIQLMKNKVKLNIDQDFDGVIVNESIQFIKYKK